MVEGIQNSMDMDAGQQFAATDVIVQLLEASAPHQRILLNVLAVADRDGIDPVPLIFSLAEELTSTDKRRTLELAEKMAEGVQAVDALELVPNSLPASCVLALRLARDEGALSRLYSVLLDRYHGNEAEPSSCDEHFVPVLARMSGRVFAIVLIISFIMLKIIPEFQKMMEEFQTEPPPEFRLFLRVFDVVTQFWFVPFLLMLCVLPFCFTCFLGYFRRWRPLKWRQRTFSTAVNRRRSLALMAQGSNSLKSKIAMILESVSLTRIFPRLSAASERIDEGQNIWESFAAEKIISKRESKALALTTTGDTQAWLLRWSAADQETRRATRRSFLLTLFLVTTNVALVLMVVLTCVAVFATYIQMAASMQ